MDTALIGLIAATLVALVFLFLTRRPDESLPSDSEAEPESREAQGDAAQRALRAESPSRSTPSLGQQDTAPGARSPLAQPATATATATETAARELPAEPAEARASAEAEVAAKATPDQATPTTQAGEAVGPPDNEAAEEQPQDRVAALKRGLAGTRGGFITRLAKLFSAKPEIDASLIEDIEEVLITADIGVKTADRILTHLRERMNAGALEDEDAVWRCLREQAEVILSVDAGSMRLGEHKPSLLLIAGVNGVGKTTTIGKLASKYTAQGRRVLLAAGDTFRAAAVLQLEVWGQRVGCPVVKGKEGADPSSVVFDAIKRAERDGYDLVIADTAGRLHTKQPLMEELKKLQRTASKALGGRPVDEILLVLDSTTGQNAVQQMYMFREALDIGGVVLTKLDGTAKGGVILGIVDEHKVPVRFIGLGEKVEDLREFDATSFVRALFEKPSGETMAA